MFLLREKEAEPQGVAAAGVAAPTIDTHRHDIFLRVFGTIFFFGRLRSSVFHERRLCVVTGRGIMLPQRIICRYGALSRERAL